MADQYKPSREFLMTLWLIGILFVMGAVIPAVLNEFVDRRPTKGHRIEFTLSEIDMAKQLLGKANNISNGTEVSVQDVAPYLALNLASNGIITPVAGEQYAIKPIGVPPEALLTRAVKPWPKGTVIRKHLEDGGCEIILPNAEVQRTGATPSAKETNAMSSAAGSSR
jgi:hypothetical protein